MGFARACDVEVESEIEVCEEFGGRQGEIWKERWVVLENELVGPVIVW